MTNFDTIIDRRNTRSIKWDAIGERFDLQQAEDVLPMWIADMDFKAPKAVIQAIQETIEHGVFGYSFVCEGCKDALQNWLSSRHNWSVQHEWMLTHHGVVPAIASVIETFTTAGDKILITPPVYPPFFQVPGHMNREVITCEMDEEDGQYSMNFEKFEAALQEDVKIFILCNPHNPGGIVWTKEVLLKMLDLCKQYGVLILSDEIHADLVFDGATHIPLASIAGDAQDQVITCVAPTKTFNLAGVQASFLIVSDEQLREKLVLNTEAHGQMNLSVFAAAAVKAAYEDGGPWLDELLETLSRNIDYVIEQFEEHLPTVHVKKPDATYLLWIDYRDTGLSEDEIMTRLLHKGKVALEPGSKYGEAGRGFLRMNIACPLSLVKDGVNRFIYALSN